MDHPCACKVTRVDDVLVLGEPCGFHGDWRRKEVHAALLAAAQGSVPPVAMRLHCPECGELHVDRGEFATKTDARQALGVRSIVDDAAFYDQLKLLARFVRLAGYDGLMVCLDEMVNLYKLANVQARNANYEQILRILNDSLQGSAVGLGFVLGGTPEFLLDTRRGLYSYSALQGRLSQNQFANAGLVDFTGPVVRLTSLTPEDFYVLLQKIRHVHAGGEEAKYALPDNGIYSFMEHCSKRVGDTYFRTPRTTITAFINLLAVLEQNAGASWQQLLGAIDVARDTGGEADVEVEGDDDFASFKL